MGGKKGYSVCCLLFQPQTHSTKLKDDQEESNTQFCFQSKVLVHTGPLTFCDSDLNLRFQKKSKYMNPVLNGFFNIWWLILLQLIK